MMIRVIFETSGPLGMYITEDADGQVVINGSPDTGYELDPKGTAAQHGLRRGDRMLEVEGHSTEGMDVEGVKNMVDNSGRPLELVLVRDLVHGAKMMNRTRHLAVATTQVIADTGRALIPKSK